MVTLIRAQEKGETQVKGVKENASNLAEKSASENGEYKAASQQCQA